MFLTTGLINLLMTINYRPVDIPYIPSYTYTSTDTFCVNYSLFSYSVG